MFALRVVEEFDVIEHVLAGFFAGFVFPAADSFAFEQVKEALDNCVIPAVATAAHVGDQIVLLSELLPFIAGELGTLIGMYMDLCLWLATPDGQVSKIAEIEPVLAALERATAAGELDAALATVARRVAREKAQ